MFDYIINNMSIILGISLTIIGVCASIAGAVSFVIGAVESKTAKEWEKLEKLEWNIDENNRKGRKG